MKTGSRLTLVAAVAAMVTAIAAPSRRASAQTGQTEMPARPLMVEDVFKNVQALKGIGVDDFMLTMGVMSAAVGSDCVGCHPSAGTDHVDWAIDTPRKRTARRMVQMVTAINREHFNGRQVVTCWTCHRGRDRPVTTPTLEVVYGAPNEELDDVLGQAQGVPSVDQVLEKYLQAIGGAQNVSRVTSFVATGKSVGYKGFGGNGVVEVSAAAPDKRATYITFPEYPDRGVSVRTYDGRTGWIATPLAVVPNYELAGSERDGARLDAMLSFPAQIRQALNNLRVGPPSTVDEKNVTVVQGDGPNGTLATLYFDDVSGLLVRMVRHGRSPIGRVPTQVDYSEYRDVGRIKFPYRWTVAWLDGRDSFEFSDVKLNVPIDAAKFGRPNVAVPTTPRADAAFSKFFHARSPQEAAAASADIIASGLGFDEVFARLKQGRDYSRDVPRGIVQGSHRDGAREYFYTLNVPETYDPARRYQVRIQLHGGVGRIETNTPPRAGSAVRLAGVEQIYVMPYAWRDAPWWSRGQVENLRAILDGVKRRYNVDENRVVVSGVSDGGTGAYYTAMRETTPFASFLPLNGFIKVLENETLESDGDLFPTNLVNKPLFVVNGGRDPLYPTAAVDPYVERLRSGGVDLVYRPQPNAGHDTSWWPEIKESFEQFVADHPRRPLPDVLSWESGPPNVPARAHWLIIDRLSEERPQKAAVSDGNRTSTAGVPDFGVRASGMRVSRVVNGSNAYAIGLRAGDLILTINNQSIPSGADVAEILDGYPSGRPLLITVARGTELVRLTGRYAPTILTGDADAMFPRQAESGRVDLARIGNKVEAKTRGVARFTLLLSPDQFDLSRPVTVVVNGRTVFEGVVQKSTRTLVEWAARDDDRTMLFAVELPIDVPQ